MDDQNVKDRGLVRESFRGIVELIRSRNKEDFNLALSIIEENNIDDPIALVFFWKHCTNAKKQMWQDQFPKSYKDVKEATVDVGTSVNRIYQYARTANLDVDTKRFIEDNIGIFLHKTLVGYGFGFVKEMNIKIW